MFAADAATIAKQLYDVRWDWSHRGAEASLRAAGWAHTSEGEHRVDFARDRWHIQLYRTGAYPHVEATLDVTWPAGGPPGTVEKVEERYAAEYETAVAAVASLFGKPAFDGPAGRPGFPDGEQAVRCAVWNEPGARIMVAYRHGDDQHPYRLAVVARPPVDDIARTQGLGHSAAGKEKG
jgi:hypothetical protein